MRTKLATLLATALLLTACNGEGTEADPPPRPSPPDSSSASPTESSSATPTEPPRPGEASQRTEAGAKAFVDYWIELFNYAQATGQTDELRRSQSPKCAWCRGGTESIERIYGSGRHLIGGVLTIGTLNGIRRAEDSDFAFSSSLSVTPQELRREKKILKRTTGGDLRMAFQVEWWTGSWRMNEIDTIR